MASENDRDKLEPRLWRPRDADAARAALLRAGETLFAERGFEGATVGQIAEAADVNRSMISYYFGDKEGLYLAIIDDAVSEITREFGDADHAVDDPAAAMHAHIIRLGSILPRRPEFPAMLVREYMSRSSLPAMEIVNRISVFYRETKRILDAGVAAGVFQPANAHMFHLQIIGAIAFFASTMRARRVMQHTEEWAEDAQLENDAYIDQLARLAVSGLRR